MSASHHGDHADMPSWSDPVWGEVAKALGLSYDYEPVSGHDHPRDAVAAAARAAGHLSFTTESTAGHLLGHLVTLRAIHDAPTNPQLQEQWGGRLQGMAMAGLVWRFPDQPWQPTAYGRRVIDISASDPRLVAIFGDPPEPLGIIVGRWAEENGYTSMVTERHPEGEWFGPDGASATGLVTSAWLAAISGPPETVPVVALEPAESMALTVALAQVRRNEEPTPNVAATVVLALARLAGLYDWTRWPEEQTPTPAGPVPVCSLCDYPEPFAHHTDRDAKGYHPFTHESGPGS